MGFEEAASGVAHPTSEAGCGVRFRRPLPRRAEKRRARPPPTLALFKRLGFALLEVRLQGSPGRGLRLGPTGGARGGFLPPRAGHARAAGGLLRTRGAPFGSLRRMELLCRPPCCSPGRGHRVSFCAMAEAHWAGLCVQAVECGQLSSKPKNRCTLGNHLS